MRWTLTGIHGHPYPDLPLPLEVNIDGGAILVGEMLQHPNRDFPYYYQVVVVNETDRIVEIVTRPRPRTEFRNFTIPTKDTNHD